MEKKLSRRSFLKGAAASTLGVAALGVAGIASAEDLYKAGTYSAIVKGYGGYIKVDMTFSESAITDCVINSSCETPTIGGAACEEIAAAVVANQTVDAVSSVTASLTVPAVQKAIANCVAQARGEAAALNEMPLAADDGDWLGQAPEITDDMISEERSTSLLIVGGGNGGMLAAATAADAGMDFMLCEKSSGVTTCRFWVGAVDTEAHKEAGIQIDKNRLMNELTRYASGKCDADVLKLWLNYSGETMDYLKSLGFIQNLHIAPESHVGGEGVEYYVPSQWLTLTLPEGSPYNSAIGANRHAFLEEYIGKKGYKIDYNMNLVRLCQDEKGKVLGAIFENGDGAYVKVNADNVILATGGYAANSKMVEALAPIAPECCTTSIYYGPDDGQGIKAGLWAGAKMDTTCAPMIFDRGLVAPGTKAGYVVDEMGNKVFPGPVPQYAPGSQPHLKVNKEGKRFANESVPYDFMSYAASLQTDGVYAMIMDADVENAVIAYDQYGCAKLGVDMAMMGALRPEMDSYVEQGLMVKADTIPELAEKLGIPADALVATVERYNELCEKGVDEDFGKEPYRMRALVNAPYYGAFMGGTLLCTCDGLRINHKCQVYDKNHKIIEGLYSVGDCSGSFFSGNYPEYFVGVASGRTMTEGRYAVKAILGEKF